MMPIRWEPGRRIVRADRLMDRLMRETWEPLRSWPAIWDGHIRPALDVYETQDQVVVKAALAWCYAQGPGGDHHGRHPGNQRRGE